MASAEEIEEFLFEYELGDDSWIDGEPRVWFQYLDLEGKVAVYCLAGGESASDQALKAMADRGVAALAAKFPDCAGFTTRLEEE